MSENRRRSAQGSMSGRYQSRQRGQTGQHASRYSNIHHLVDLPDQCRKCRRPGCGYYVCDCRGRTGVICLSCLERTIRDRNSQLGPRQSMICPLCGVGYFGIQIIRSSSFTQMTGISSGITIFCVLGPLVIFGLAIVCIGTTRGWADHWVKVFSGLLVFIYIFECLLFGYCFYNCREEGRPSRLIRGIRLTPKAIRIRNPEEVRWVALQLRNLVEQMARNKKRKDESEDSQTICKYEIIRFYLFIAFKWLQVLICFITIIMGILFELIFLIWGKKGWRNYKLADQVPKPDKCECNLTIINLRFWWDVIFWVFVEVSIPGLIGAAGEILFLQIMYAVAATPIYPYCIIPWIVTGGLYKGWSTFPESTQ